MNKADRLEAEFVKELDFLCGKENPESCTEHQEQFREMMKAVRYQTQREQRNRTARIAQLNIRLVRDEAMTAGKRILKNELMEKAYKAWGTLSPILRKNVYEETSGEVLVLPVEELR